MTAGSDQQRSPPPLQRIWHLLTDPPSQVTHAHQRRRLRAFLILVLGVLTFWILYFGGLALLGGRVTEAIPGVLLLGLAYALGRSSYYEYGKALLFTFMLLVPFVLHIHDPLEWSLLLLNTAATIIIANLLLSWWALLAVLTLKVAASLIVVLSTPELLWWQSLIPVPFALVLCVFAAFNYLITQRDIRQLNDLSDKLNFAGERFRRLVELSPEMIAIHQHDRYVYINPAGVKLLGAKSEDEILGRLVEDFVESQDRDTFSAQVSRDGTNIAIYTRERFIRLDGVSIPVEVTSTPITYENGMATQLMVRDTTRQRKAEAALRQSEKKFRSLANSLTAGVVIVQDGQFQYCNQIFEAYSGYSAEALSDIDPFSLIHPDDREMVRDYSIRRLMGEDVPGVYECRVVNAEGVTLWAEFRPSRIDYEGKPATLLSIIDVTERKRERETFEQLDAAVQQINDAVMITRPQPSGPDQIIYVNQAFCTLTGYSQKELLGQSSSLLRGEQTESDKPLASYETLERGQMISRELVRYHKDGTTVRTHWDIKPVLDDNGQVSHMIAIQRDRSTELALAESEARYRQLVEISPYVIAIHDLEGQFHYVNPTGLELLGYSEAEVANLNIRDILPPDEIEKAQMRRDKRVSGQSEPLHYELKVMSKHGVPRLMQSTSTLVQLNGADRVLLTLNDITDYQEAKTAFNVSSERYRLVSELMTDYAYALDLLPDGESRFVWITGAFSEITGRDREDMKRLDDLVMLIHEEDRPVFRNHIKMLQTGYTDVSEFRLVTPDGMIRWLRDHARIYRGDHQEGTRIYGATHDITDRVQAEESLKTHALQQAVVAELGQLALANVNASVLMQQAVNLISQVLDVAICEILEYEPASDQLRLIARIGWSPEFPSSTAFSPDVASPAVKKALMGGEPEIVTSWASGWDENQDWYVFLRNQKVASSVFVPIHGRDPSFGLLNVHSSTTREFPVDVVNFLQSIANVLGTFISQTQVRDAEREQRMLAEALRDVSAILTGRFELDKLFDRILHLVSQVVTAHDAATIMLTQEDGETVRIVSTSGYDDETVAMLSKFTFTLSDTHFQRQMIATRRPVIIDDVRTMDGWVQPPSTTWIRSYLGAPIFVENDCIGIINLDSSQVAAFKPVHADRLMAFANQASVAIQNARHTKELERHVIERTRQLNAERRQLEVILEASGEGILYIESEHIKFANQAFCDMVGMKQAALVGLHSSVLLNGDGQHLLADIEATLRKDTIWRGERRIYRADKTFFEAGLTISRIGTVDDEDVLRAVTIVRDISQAKRLEAQKARFIANAAHELRSPIATLNTRLYLLRRQPDKVEVHAGHLEKVSKRMNRLVEDLLDLTRFEQGHIVMRRQDTIVQDLIAEVMEIQGPEAEKRDIELTHEVPLEPVHIFADSDRLMQVFINLTGNAMNYSSENGHIAIRVRVEDNHVIIMVEDDGVGISETDLQHIFQPFFRVENGGKVRGAGLGLSISREIVIQHDGEISVESEPGKGSCFIVKLPIMPVD